MAKVSRYPAAQEYIRFFCPGCKQMHAVVEGRWTFNGDVDKPTFSPSVLVKSGHYVEGHSDQCWCNYYKENPEKEVIFKCGICHSFVKDGMIQFLSDCTHELAGQTVPLPDWNDDDY